MDPIENDNSALLAGIAVFGLGQSGPGQLAELLTEAEAQEKLNLERFAGEDSDLARLKGWLTYVNEHRLAEVRGFVSQNPKLGELLEDHRVSLGKFNLFETLDLYRREEVHSRALAWLLDPNQNHGLGASVLKGFLLAAGLINPEETDGRDWSGTTVEREWFTVVDGGQGYLDILLVNESFGTLCAIENKVFSPEGIGGDEISQLTRYRKALENDFPDFAKCYVFLSPDGRDAYDEEERPFWKPLTYGAIVELVEKAAGSLDTTLHQEVRLFLQQYTASIRRNIVQEPDDVQKLARRIYLENREVVDLLKRSQPNWVDEAKQMLREAVAGQSHWKLDVEDPQFVRFRLADWDQFPSSRTGTGWSGSESLILFQFRFWDSKPWLDLGLSPGSDVAIRERLFDAVRQNPGVFRLKEKAMKDWMILHEEKDYILDDNDYGPRWDDGSVRGKIMDWVSAFAGNRFREMNGVIVDCLKEYERGKP